MKKVGTDELTQEEIDQHFSEEVKNQRSSGSITKSMGTWMNKLEKLSASAVTKMKTYIKKKEIEEEPMNDLHDELTIDEDDQANMESTEASKTNSEASPPKDLVLSIKKEVEYEQISKPNEEASPEKFIIEESQS